MYDPSIGRWLSEDPLGFEAGDSNLYRYVGNGPTNATDPSGLEWINGRWTGTEPPPPRNPPSNWDRPIGLPVLDHIRARNQHRELVEHVRIITGFDLDGPMGRTPEGRAWILDRYRRLADSNRIPESTIGDPPLPTGVRMWGPPHDLRTGQGWHILFAFAGFGGIPDLNPCRPPPRTAWGHPIEPVPTFIIPPNLPPPHLESIGDLDQGYRPTLASIWRGSQPLAAIPSSIRLQLAYLYLQVAMDNPMGSAQSAFNHARALYLLGEGPNPGPSVVDYARRMEILIHRRGSER